MDNRLSLTLFTLILLTSPVGALAEEAPDPAADSDRGGYACNDGGSTDYAELFGTDQDAKEYAKKRNETPSAVKQGKLIVNSKACSKRSKEAIALNEKLKAPVKLEVIDCGIAPNDPACVNVTTVPQVVADPGTGEKTYDKWESFLKGAGA
jgi:hypothetical protein